MPVEKEREFDYELPEALANADNKAEIEAFVKGTLEQHTNFVREGYNGFVAPDQVQAEATKLMEANKTKESKAKEAKTTFDKKVRDYISSKGAPEANIKIIKDASRVDFDENQDDDAWKQKIDNYLKETPGLVKTTIAGVSKQIVIETKTKEKPKKKSRFFMRG